jgi:hypothetical protein
VDSAQEPPQLLLPFDCVDQRVILARLAVLVRLAELARLALLARLADLTCLADLACLVVLARLPDLTECGPIAGETPPVCSCIAGRTRVEPLSCGVGSALPMGSAPSQKFNSPDFTWLLAEK